MSELPALLGSGASFEVEGTVYRYRPLTLGDEADIEQEVRAQLGARLDVIASVEKIVDQFKPDDRKLILENAIREHFRLSRMGGIDLANEFQLPDVHALILKYHLRAEHPELNTEDCKRLLAVGGPAISRMITDQVRSVQPGEASRPSCAGGSASRWMRSVWARRPFRARARSSAISSRNTTGRSSSAGPSRAAR